MALSTLAIFLCENMLERQPFIMLAMILAMHLQLATRHKSLRIFLLILIYRGGNYKENGNASHT